MKTLRILGAVLALSLLAAACDNGDDDGSSATGPGSDTTTGAGEATIDREATIRFASTTHPSQLDPHHERNTEEFQSIDLLYDRLLALDHEKQIQPLLAEDWEFSDDGLTLTLTIREGATFHDGSPIDAEAARASLERAMTLEGSTQASKLTNVTDVSAPDATTLVFSFEVPDRTILTLLASSAGTVLNPAVIAAGTDISQDPGAAGSGPYTVASFAPDDSGVYERYEGYWNPDAANFARIEMIKVADQAIRLQGLRSGEFDAMVLAETLVPEAEATEGTRLVQYPGDSMYSLFMRPEGPLASREVRQAIRYAIDREVISEGLFDGQSPVAHQPFRSGLGRIEDFEDPYSYDPDRARELLAEAGSPDGVVLEGSLLAGVSPQDQMGEVIQQQLAEVGITLNLTPLDTAQYVATFQDGTYVATPQVLAGRSDPWEWTANAITGVWTFAGDDAGRIAEMALQAADPSLSDDDVEAIWADIVQEIIDEAWYAPISWRDVYILWPDDIVNEELMTQYWRVSFSLRFLGRSGD